MAVVTAAMLAAGGSVLTAAPALAAPAASTAVGRFLGGSALGIDLDQLVSVAPADARNTGGATVTDVHPLDVTALQAVDVNLGNGLNLLGQNGLLTLGAVNQYASASADGSSTAATGAVTNTGAIGVGDSGVPQSNASFDLAPLIGADAADALADLRLNVDAVAATATQGAGADAAQTGDYGIAGLDLQLTSPALASTVAGLRTTLGTLQPTVDAVPGTLQGLLGGLVTVSGLPDLQATLDSATDVTSADGSITANLQTGAITIDVARLLAAQGLDIDNLPANTQLMPYITTALTTQLLPALSDALTGVVNQITSSLNGLTATVAGLPVPAGQLLGVVGPVVTAVTTPISNVVAGLGDTVVTPLANALTPVVGVQANVQESNGGVFTQRAIRVALVPAADTAVVDLASASVGPNAGPLAVPTLTGLSPDNGPVGGGTVVTVTGTDFTDDSTVSVDGSAPITPSTVSSDGTSLTFASPAHAAGPADVTVTTPTGTSGPLTFTYDPAPAGAPVLTTLDPDSGPAAGGTAVTITGTGFGGDATVSVDGSAPITPTAITDTSLTFTTPGHAPAAVPVTVTTSAGTSEPLTFTYLPPAPAGAPTVTGIDPASGPAAGGTSVTLTGTGFTADSTVSVDGSAPITPDGDVTDTTLTFTTPAHVAGEVPVTVTTGDGTSEPITFTYDPAPAGAPVLATIDPASGPAVGGTTVTITGTGFTPDATVSVDGGAPITPTEVTDTTVTFTTPAHDAGEVPVTVTTGAGTSEPIEFTYDAPPAGAPALTSLDPDHGPAGGGTTVTITGTGFTPDATVSVDGGAPITPDTVTDTTITFTTPAHTAGTVPVTVTTAAGGSEPLEFTYDAPPAGAPTIAGLDPDNGPVTGGTQVEITGSGFTADSTVSVDGGDPITPTLLSGTRLRFVTPAHAAGPVPVTVTTDGVTSEPSTFTYAAVPTAAPTLTTIDPGTGPTAGGTSVTIGGTGFTPDSTVSVDGGDPITPDAVSDDGTSLTFTTPAHAAGDVPVTVTNGGGTSDPITFTYAAVVAAPVITDPTNGEVVPDTTPTISGTGTPRFTVRVAIGTSQVCTTTVAEDGTWSCTPTLPLPEGTWTLTATQTSPEGIESDPSDPVAFTIPAGSAGDPIGTDPGTGSGIGTGSGTTGTGTGGSSSSTGGLAYTGADLGPALGLALLFLLLGSALVTARRLRRR